MALQDLLMPASVDELIHLQKQLRLQSLKQLELLQTRQAQFKNSRTSHSDVRQTAASSADDLINSHRHNRVVTENLYGRSYLSPETDSILNGVHGDYPVRRTSTSTSIADLGKAYHPSVDLGKTCDGMANNNSHLVVSARTAREKLASSSTVPNGLSTAVNHVHSRVSDRNQESSADALRHALNGNDCETHVSCNQSSVARNSTADRVVTNKPVVTGKPPVHKLARSTVESPSGRQGNSRFDSSYTGTNTSLNDSSRLDRSCTPDRVSRSLEGTPKSILRHRQLIDRNVHVDSKYEHTPTTKGSRRGRRDLNHSYTNVDDSSVGVSKSKSVNFDVDCKHDRDLKQMDAFSRDKKPAGNRRVLEQGSVEKLASVNGLYYSGTSSAAADGVEALIQRKTLLADADKAKSAKGLSGLETSAPPNLLLNAGNDRKNARVVCELDKRSRSSMFSDDEPQKSQRMDGSTLHSSGGSFLEDTISNRPYTKLLAGREREEPLLGYDWIAGLMDNERSLADIPDDCFEEVREFRRQHKDACVGSYDLLRSYEIGRPVTPEVDNPTHTCIHGYIVNDRLFTEPVNVNEQGVSVCPVCLSTRKEPTAESPGFVRVSIPQKTLNSAYKVKPHRRRSFDATDSCALAKHCLAGWECSHPSVVPTASNLDLKHATNGLRSQMITTEAEMRNLASGFSKTSRLLNTRTVEPNVLETDRPQHGGMRTSSVNTSRAKEAKASGTKKR